LAAKARKVIKIPNRAAAISLRMVYLQAEIKAQIRVTMNLTELYVFR
jgi:hypothetical protein